MSVMEKSFEDWTSSDLLTRRAVLLGQREALWTPGHHDSFYRDRYDRDAAIVNELVAIDGELLERMFLVFFVFMLHVFLEEREEMKKF